MSDTKIVFSREGVELRSDYVIHWERIDSYPKLCEWVCHLSEKSWVTKSMLREIIFKVEEHFGWPHAFNC